MSVEEKTLVNVKKVNFIDEVTNKKYTVVTGNEIDIQPIKSNGKRDILRVKNVIYGINETEDITIGYKFKLKDSLFNVNVMALIDGGTVKDNKYFGTEAGKIVERHPFTMEIFTEEKDYSRTVGYAKFIYKHCKGKPSKYKIKDGAFMVPEYEVESIPFRGERPVDIEFVKSLDDKNVDPKADKQKESDNATTELKVKGDKVVDNNKDVQVEITSNIKWIFEKQINQDDVTSKNFIVENKNSKERINGNVTIDDSKKIVTFTPISIEKATTYVAEAKSVKLLDDSDVTIPIKTEFTTI